MQPRERRETGEMDLFRSCLDQIITMNHELVRLMAGLAILKHTFNLSDDELCARWVENPYFQFFCGETFFRHDLPSTAPR